MLVIAVMVGGMDCIDWMRSSCGKMLKWVIEGSLASDVVPDSVILHFIFDGFVPERQTNGANGVWVDSRIVCRKSYFCEWWSTSRRLFVLGKR